MKYILKEKLLSLHGTYLILNENEEECYRLVQKVLSATDKSYLYDANEQEIAFIHKKLISVHAVHYIEMANGEQAEMATNKLLQLHDNFVISGFDWAIEGDIMSHNFRILDRTGREIAVSHEKWITAASKYVVDVLDPSQTEKVLTVMCTLALIHKDMRAAASNNHSTSNRS